MTTMAGSIQRERHETHTVLRMTHGKANALDVELADAITHALEEEEASDSRAIIITGTGSIFSAGVDLLRVLDGGRDYVIRFVPALSRCLMKLFTVTKPVVAAVNGHAIAGGCVMACAADFSIMARASGRIGVPELKVGVPFPPVALEIMRFALAQPYFDEAVYGGETHAPEDASTGGFVRELAPAHNLLKRAAEVAQELATIPHRTFALTKITLRTPAIETIQRLNGEIGEQIIDAWASDEVLASMRKYVDRTIKKK